ncbi:MAG: hypothetical protein ACRCWJ_12920 [Casimicrobium sp.]
MFIRSVITATFFFGFFLNVSEAVTGTATIECVEQDIGNGKKELTCNLGAVKFVVPNSLSLPPSVSGNQFDLTASSTGFACNPTVSGVAGGTQQQSTFTANCTGSSAPTVFTWAAIDPTAAAAASLNIQNPSAQNTTASLTLGAAVSSLGIRFTACTTQGVGCQTFDRSIANTSIVQTPSGCSITGVPTSAVAENANVNLGVSGCQNLQGSPTYTWRYNGGNSIGSATTLSHVPFPSSSSAASGSYTLTVCNPNGNATTGCATFPNANGVTVNKASSGGELALCPAGTVFGIVSADGAQGVIDFGRESSKLFRGVTDSGDIPVVFRVTVPNPTPSGETEARLTWNSSIGASTGKTVKISRNQACGSVGAATLGSTWDSGARNVTYRASSVPYFDAGSVWYVMVTSPGCTANCNFNLEIFK